MGIFGEQNTWAEKYPECGGADQSPINLSRTFAKPCPGLCDIEIKDEEITNVVAVANTQSNSFSFTYKDGPTMMFEGTGYKAQLSVLSTPGHHAVEGVNAKAEFITLFQTPTGQLVALSVPLRVSSDPTPSNQFFNSLVSYVNDIDKEVSINLPEGTKLAHVIPIQDPSYYIYNGSWIGPGCGKMKWIVFENSVNIDPNTLSQIIGKVQSGSRDLQDLRDREVFINDVDAIKGAEGENSGKVYLKCRRLGVGTPTVSPVLEQPKLSEIKQKNNSDKTKDNIQYFFTEPVVFGVFSYAAVIALILFGLCPFLYFLFFTRYPIEISTLILNAISGLSYNLIRKPIEYVTAPPTIPNPQ